jgi:hypothetical protein
VLTELERLLEDLRHDPERDGEHLRRGGPRLAALLTACQYVSARLGFALSLRYFSHIDEVPRVTVGT